MTDLPPLPEPAILPEESYDMGLEGIAYYTDDQLREYAKQAVEAERARLLSYDKTDMNGFVSDLYDEKTREGKHGHYETVFHVVHCAIKRVASD